LASIDGAQGKLEELIRLGLVDLTLQEVLCATSHWLRRRSDQGKPTPETKRLVHSLVYPSLPSVIKAREENHQKVNEELKAWRRARALHPRPTMTILPSDLFGPDNFQDGDSITTRRVGPLHECNFAGVHIAYEIFVSQNDISQEQIQYLVVRSLLCIDDCDQARKQQFVLGLMLAHTGVSFSLILNDEGATRPPGFTFEIHSFQTLFLVDHLDTATRFLLEARRWVCTVLAPELLLCLEKRLEAFLSTASGPRKL
jgi:hypothetical protein